MEREEFWFELKIVQLNPIKSKLKVLVTGANGFVGSSVVRALLDSDHSVVAAVRQLPLKAVVTSDNRANCPRWVSAGAVNQHTQWETVLHGVNTVVHCAGRAHIMRKHRSDDLRDFREVNVGGTLNLASHAVVAGVQRFIYLSTIGVNGNKSLKPFTEDDIPNPYDAYSVSKLEAETGLLALAQHSSMEVVIIRPPLVYGPNAPGNFGKLVKWLQSGILLPLGAVYNRRSLIALENLVSIILLCTDRIRSPEAANNIFVVCDGEDVSTTDLLRKVALVGGFPCRLLPVPSNILRASARIIGKGAMVDRLLANLQVDDTKARRVLGWRPVVTLDEQLGAIFLHQNMTVKP